jgi:hypothetical protein
MIVMTTEADVIRTKAEQQFLAFVSLPHETPYGYRLDTYQLWPACDGNHMTSPERPFGCVNPGIVIGIDTDDPEQPFIASLGPWELMRSDNLFHLYDLTVETLVPVVLTASLHLHVLGYPCHESCCCDEDTVDS